MSETTSVLRADDSGLPPAEHARIVRLLTSYSVIALAYVAVSAPLYLFIQSNILAGQPWYVLGLRRQYATIIVGMFLFFVAVYVLSLLHYVTLPYSAGNFGFFLFSLGVDQKLQAAIAEAGLLTRRLQHEKETVEEKVRLRTSQYRAEHAKPTASISSLEQGFMLVNAQLHGLKEVPPVMADEGRLRQIMYNLLSNANKYTSSGTITVDADVQGSNLRLRVTDTGKALAARTSSCCSTSFSRPAPAC